MIFGRAVIAALALAGLASSASAGPIDTAAYSLNAITGAWTYGRTDWNAVSEFGTLNNVTELATVENILQDGYLPISAAQSNQRNGIYNWPTAGLHALTFSFVGGADYVLDTFSFLSSRSYGSATPVSVEYSLDGGVWQLAAQTTSGALGITTGAANWYNLSLGNVTADAFRLNFNGGNQISLHELGVSGTEVASVPEPGTLILFASGIAGVVAKTRRRRVLSSQDRA